MVLGEWWVANPTGDGVGYEPPDPGERVPGTLREIAQGEYVLETIGFLGDRPFLAGGPAAASDRSRPEIWGTDRDATCYSLFDSLRSNSTWRPGHVSDGHEDWRVGWLAKGNVWMTSGEECSSARIRIDDLHRWALYRRPDNVEFNDSGDIATIDLRAETLGTKMIGDTRVSLVRGSSGTYGGAGQEPERHFSFANVVSWQVEGPVRLRSIVEDWIGPLESFSRFMTLAPSVVSGIDCRFGDSDEKRLHVELIVPRLQRGSQAADRGGDESSPHEYLTTLRTLQELDIDPLDVFAAYWREVATGDAYMAMELHLESQDRLLSRGPDAALLNAIRSVESLYAAQHRGAAVEHVSVQVKIDDAVSSAGDVGAQVLDAWPELRRTGELRRDVAHGRGPPSASFGLRCLGGAMALQWIQRLRLLTESGIGDGAASSIVSENYQYSRDLRTLQDLSTELGDRPAP